MARRCIPVNGFSTGLIDEQYEDRADIQGIANSLRECVNFVPSGSGALVLRGELSRVGNWKDFDAAAETVEGGAVSFSNIKVYPYDSNYCCVVVSSASKSYIFRWDGTTATTCGTLPVPNPSCVLRVGTAMYFFKNNMNTRYCTNFGAATAATDVPFYREISGTVEVAQRMVVKITGPLSGVGVPEAIPVVGESIKGSTGGATATGKVLRVRLIDPSGAQTLWQYEIIVGSFNGSCTAADVINFGTSDCVSEVITGFNSASTNSYLFGTGTLFVSESMGTSIKLAGTARTISSTLDEELLQLNAVITSVAGVRAFTAMTSPQFTCGALSAGRLFFAGNGRSASEDYVGGENSAVFSDAEDPHVIVAAANVIPNPASAIKITLLSGGTGIKWAAGGDSLFVGTDYGEYSMTQPRVANEPNSFPVFKLAGQYGSSSTPVVAVNDGRVVFAPRSGGDIVAIQYLDTNDRFSGVPLNPYTSSIISDGVKAIAIQPRRDGEDSARIFVLDAVGDSTLRVGTFQKDNIAWATLRVDAIGNNTAPVKFYDLVEFGKEVYAVMQLQQTKMSFTTLVSFCLCKLDITQTDGYALDFRTDADKTAANTWTIDGTAGTTAEPSLCSRDVTVIGSRNGQWVPYGTVTTSATGVFTVSDDADFDDIKVGIPVTGIAKLPKIILEDENGNTLGKKVRLIAATINVLNTRQLSLNGQNLLPTRMDGTVYQPFTRGAKMGFLGWAQDHNMTLQTVAPNQATIKSVMYEVST